LNSRQPAGGSTNWASVATIAQTVRQTAGSGVAAVSDHFEKTVSESRKLSPGKIAKGFEI
jgi:hypothetical protein